MAEKELSFDKELFKRSVLYNIKTLYRRTLEEATPQQIYQATAYAIKDQIIDYWMDTQKAIEERDPKTVYYMSMEFLMGRALGNNLINLKAYEGVQEVMDELGIDLDLIEDQEPDPALGNGGLGRLAACFLDSLATLGYPAYGCGIRYKYGMFRQEIHDGYQVEKPDDWLVNGNPFELRRPEYAKIVKFGGYVNSFTDENGRMIFRQEGYTAVRAIPYDLPVIGYGNGVIDTLRIWDAEPINSFQLDSFDKGDYQKAVEQENLASQICEVLYPNDNHIAGKELRLKQQYFFISASVQTAVQKYMKNHNDIRKFYEKNLFQLNDTHPTVAVAELMRVLMDDYFLSWEDAWEVTTKTCCYTNHTIMAEALEKWPVDLFQRLLPRIYQIVDEINRRFCNQIIQTYSHMSDHSIDVDEKIRKMAIIYDNQVKMAHLAIVGGHSVNGVAKLHTEILKKRELKDFYEMMPEKFNNKTNGITQRRFLLHANPKLAKWVTKKIGDGWITDLSQLSGLKKSVDVAKAQKEFMDIKRENKVRLSKYILAHNGITVDPDSIFDCQVKRLHEYKRQLLNILHVIYLYDQIKKNPKMKMQKETFIFGAKAAAGYRNAKLTIKLINAVADVVNNDSDVDGRIKVVFIEDYRVSNAELIFAAADVSEQISTASKEASGTGNMKMMLNGAVTLGTMDGANVEIVQEVGEENAFIFGLSSDEVIEHERLCDYRPEDIYNKNQEIKRIVDHLVDGTFSKDRELFRPLWNSLLNTKDSARADTYFILKDFESYKDAQERVREAYGDKKKWAHMAMMQTACCGKFSSDRTIQEYVDEIWYLDKVEN
ncbi:glycogen/starch/alpha-glucan phosphorylase [Butyrivibrio sp. NC3005]|jgi:starch phosphorylase|uniref:glycogen/starch/alpha-glucan phosphorylase n=1 Tax=Butyrivibrio sp. NC3005 TaxID=1280685 RepID=UPI000414F6FE|nr:glycogen/starch/alpha-glucan phosphorylase [Butyrivibrio sp. NC3005]